MRRFDDHYNKWKRWERSRRIITLLFSLALPPCLLVVLIFKWMFLFIVTFCRSVFHSQVYSSSHICLTDFKLHLKCAFLLYGRLCFNGLFWAAWPFVSPENLNTLIHKIHEPISSFVLLNVCSHMWYLLSGFVTEPIFYEISSILWGLWPIPVYANWKDHTSISSGLTNPNLNIFSEEG